MKRVSIEMNNIQSHASTAFTLEPGLNFILADDNNVGKSTIFKALSTVCRMPKVSNEDLSELMRGNTYQAYISFKYEDHHIIFWMFRDGTQIRAFFESRDDGTSIRSQECPAHLLEAFDIVLGSNGVPINFNDADSVQLIVQDSQASDEVLAKVLIDERVENVKANLYQLDHLIVQDYKLYSAREQDSEKLLASMKFNDAVDDFFAEDELMSIASYVSDNLSGIVDTDALSHESVSVEDLGRMQSALSVLNVLEGLTQCQVTGIEVPEIESLGRVLKLVQEYNRLNLDSILVSTVSAQALGNIQVAIATCDLLQKALTQINVMARCAWESAEKTSEIATLEQKLATVCKVLKCPVKGEVYFSDEKCIPTGN